MRHARGSWVGLVLLLLVSAPAWSGPRQPSKGAAPGTPPAVSARGSDSALRSILATCRRHKADRGKGAALPAAWMLDPAAGASQLARLAASGALVRPVRVGSMYDLVEMQVNRILEYRRSHGAAGLPPVDMKTGRGVVAMNALARVLSMHDLDGNGFLGTPEGKGRDITLNAAGLRETGTFVKNILVLPYLKALGYNTVHLQPITEIGVYGRKGNQGSPFAIRDPFTIDGRLADPLFEQSTDQQYLAFLQAAHILGMRVVQEVIPRTVSIDSKVLERNPDYGYWVRLGCPKRMPNYFSPTYDYVTADGKRRFADRKAFDAWFFTEYKKKIYGGKYAVEDLIDVTQTDPEYTAFFMPAPDQVKREPNGKLIGLYFKKDADGKKIPGQLDGATKSEVFPAFCDTPFEIQPFWADVTYLRLYDDVDGSMPMLRPLTFVNAKFFKDVQPDVERKYRYQPVWGMITGYFDKFKSLGVDGFVLDMGHALPEDLKTGIKRVLPNVWEENLGAGFDYLARVPITITGMVFAYAMPAFNDATDIKLYSEHPGKTVTYHIGKMHTLFREASAFDISRGRMFGSADNYNTKRIGQTCATRDLSKAPKNQATGLPDFTLAPVDPVKARRVTLLYHTIFRILAEKQASPFMVNTVFGTEWVATSTINVGLSTHMAESNRFREYMTPEERRKNPHAPRLLLMSKPDRNSGEWTNPRHIVLEMLEVNAAVAAMKPILDKTPHLAVMPTASPDVLFLALTNPHGSEKLAIVANLDLGKPHGVSLPAVKKVFLGQALVGKVAGRSVALPPASVVVFRY